MNFKNLLFFFLTVLVFTQGLLFLHDGKFEKGEFDRICNSIYSEKVWIDTCYLPYNTEVNTFTLIRNVSIVGAAVSLFFFLKKGKK